MDRWREREGGVNIEETRYNVQIPHLVTILNALVIFQLKTCVHKCQNLHIVMQKQRQVQ